MSTLQWLSINIFVTLILAGISVGFQVNEATIPAIGFFLAAIVWYVFSAGRAKKAELSGN